MSFVIIIKYKQKGAIMIRFEFRETTLRLFNTKEAAQSVAKLHIGDFNVYLLETASGFFFKNEKGVFDEDGKISKYLKEDDLKKLFEDSVVV
jgi:hypothetical protein